MYRKHVTPQQEKTPLLAVRNATRLRRIPLCVALTFAPCAFADGTIAAPAVDVTMERPQPLPSPADTGLTEEKLARLRANTSDTATLLEGQPGISLYRAGGVASLPAIHGMADDRIRIKVDGMDLVSACANHMNPPLSYIAPANVDSIRVFSGITPVSLGGDSIAGTIQVNSAAPEFAAAGEALLKGQAAAFYRSNDNARGASLNATAAAGSTCATPDNTAGETWKHPPITNAPATA